MSIKLLNEIFAYKIYPEGKKENKNKIVLKSWNVKSKKWNQILKFKDYYHILYFKYLTVILRLTNQKYYAACIWLEKIELIQCYF